jgi:hypothetical protein
MNATRLKEIVDRLLAAESANKWQKKLTTLKSGIDELVSQPASQDAQTRIVTTTAEMETTVRQFLDSLTPAQIKQIYEINGGEFFTFEVITPIKELMQQNAITPTIVAQKAGELVDKRGKYLDALRQAQSGLKELGVTAETLQPGQAEVGFLLPRDLFENELRGLHRELGILNRILRTFYEVANIAPGPIEIRQISTSDPIFFFGMDVTVLVHVGHAVKWCIDVIKGTHDIKKIAEASRAASVDEKIVAMLENQVTAKVEAAIKAKAEEIVANYAGEEGRKNELRNSLNGALELMLQRVERGMTVEIRLIPPPSAAAEQAEAADAGTTAKFEELGAIAKELNFPQLEGEPVLQLTTADSPPPPVPPA